MKYISFVFLFAFHFLPAQIIQDGSIYSRFGLGELHEQGHVQGQSMGHSGVATGSAYYLSLNNPASLASQAITRFATGYDFQGNILKDGQKQSHLLNGRFSSLQFAFPIKERKLSLGFSYQPFSRVEYHVEHTDSIRATTSAPRVDYVVSYEGSGGLQGFETALGYKINDALSVGAGVRLYNGSIEHLQRTGYAPSDYAETLVTQRTSLHGVAPKLGLILQPKLKDANQQLSFGFTATLPADLSGKRLRLLGESVGADTLGTVSSVNTQLPLQLLGGLMYRSNDKWLFSADARFDKWEDFSSNVAFGGYTAGATGAKFHNRLKIGGGFEYKPAGRNRFAPYREQIAYRLGFFTDSGYFEPVTGNRLQTLALTGGFGLPTRSPVNSIDLGFEVGTRGSTQNGLVQNMFYKVNLNLNFGERWFVRPKIQ
jgi:hypothetical protein